MTPPISDRDLFERLRAVVGRGWIDIPDEAGYRDNSGAPGLLLRSLLGGGGPNLEVPTANGWSIRYHSKNARLTLFQKEPQPRGYLDGVLRRFGWEDERGGISFSHTIDGESALGFRVASEGDRVVVRHERLDAAPYWTHDELINAFALKHQRLIVVRGRKRANRARYERGDAYEEPRTSLLVDAIVSGVIAVEFNVGTNREGRRHNHGARFRIRYDDLRHLYHRHVPL